MGRNRRHRHKGVSSTKEIEEGGTVKVDQLSLDRRGVFLLYYTTSTWRVSWLTETCKASMLNSAVQRYQGVFNCLRHTKYLQQHPR